MVGVRGRTWGKQKRFAKRALNTSLTGKEAIICRRQEADGTVAEEKSLTIYNDYLPIHNKEKTEY